MRESKTIFVTGILMIVFAVAGIILGLFLLFGIAVVAVVHEMFQYQHDWSLTFIGGLVVLVNAILQLATGITGVVLYRKARKKTGLIVLSGFIILLLLVDFVLSGSYWLLLIFVFLRVLAGLVLSGLMITGAVMSNIEFSRYKRNIS